MHIPHHFKNENIEEVKAFLKENSFGVLISVHDDRPWGTHIPLELEEDKTGKQVLYGHIAKANPQWKTFEGQEILAIFNGVHSYVSSSWYNHENVPTWNYIAVHVYGKIAPLDEEELLYSMKKLVDKYEQHSENPVRIEDLSTKTLRQMKGVFGFKIEIKEIQAAYKLSQNRSEEDYHNIIKKIDNQTDVQRKQVAKIMKKKGN